MSLHTECLYCMVAESVQFIAKQTSRLRKSLHELDKICTANTQKTTKLRKALQVALVIMVINLDIQVGQWRIISRQSERSRSGVFGSAVPLLRWSARRQTPWWAQPVGWRRNSHLQATAASSHWVLGSSHRGCNSAAASDRERNRSKIHWQKKKSQKRNAWIN